MHTPVVPQMSPLGRSAFIAVPCLSRHLDRRREGRQVGAAARGGASEAPGAALENGWRGGTCRRGSGCGKIAAAVGKGRCGCKKGEYRSSYSFSFSLLLLFNVFNRDPQIN